MARFQLSLRAEKDFLGILNYTLQAWNEAQAHRYFDRIESCCELLAEKPLIGRSCEWISPGLRRMEEASHVIFYRQDSEGVKIVRILHANMLPELNLKNEIQE